MKIIIFGGNGWIGKQFNNYLKSIMLEYEYNNNIINTNIRADNEILVNELILNHKPTHIISFIGRTHGNGINSIDYLEQEGKLVENLKDNLYAPMVLSHFAKEYNIHYTYIGTGCIFNQEEPINKKYLESDNPDFFGSSYSIVKGYTDRLMRLNKNTLNLRIRMPIVDYNHDRNFINKILNYENICSIPNSMSVLTTLYPIIFDMLKKNIVGTYNLTNPGIITHNEILEMYKEIVNPNIKWKNFSIQEQNKILKSKRSNNYLDTGKIENLYPNIPPIKDAIRDCLIKMKNI